MTRWYRAPMISRGARIADTQVVPGAAYRPGLDGLRAVAVTAVVLFHLGHLPGGNLGVDAFFVLSGWLITWKLLTVSDEADLDADVWVDGQYIGQVVAVSNRLKLAPGVHRVEVRKPGHFPVQRTVRVERKPAAKVSVEAELLGDPR